jgi:hypothetical protein
VSREGCLGQHNALGAVGAVGADDLNAAKESCHFVLEGLASGRLASDFAIGVRSCRRSGP